MPFRSKRGRRGGRVSYPIKLSRKRRTVIKIPGGKIINGKKYALLTPAEDKEWANLMAYYIEEEGLSDTPASHRAWRDLQDEFPRLKDFDDALPD